MSNGTSYADVGLKVGLEIHQQLKTSHKLFCNCPPDLLSLEPQLHFYRRLRPAQSELGQFDPASFFEFKKGRGFIYEADTQSTCLVEMDEEPPHRLDDEAIDTCITVACLLNANIVNEIHVMRKIVTDGSNTSGFQRTCIISLGGNLRVEGKDILIQTICLEEDAARLIETKETTKNYNLDRLGVPLIEIATAPVVYTPEEAEKVALALGRLIRTTGKARRGLGTIRQDINISIKDGALVEIKGVQELELISKAVQFEVLRQRKLLEIKRELSNREIIREKLVKEYSDVSQLFNDSQCKIFKTCLERDGKILALKLPKFAKLLSTELEPGLRLGTEMSDRAKFWGRVGGIFHTDELPAYGITQEEVTVLKESMKAGDLDAVVMVADKESNALDALEAVYERAFQALDGVPEETRRATADGTTRYMRPRPGAARMYPETDIPPVPVLREKLLKIEENLPELPEKKVNRFMNQYGLNEKLVNQLINSDYGDLFEEIARETKVPASVIAANLTETLKSIKREGYDVETIGDKRLMEVFQKLDKGSLTKEALPEVFMWLSSNKGPSDEAIQRLGLKILSEKELEKVIDEVIKKNVELVKRKGKDAFGLLMGLVMKEVRGKAEANSVNQILRKKLAEIK